MTRKSSLKLQDWLLNCANNSRLGIQFSDQLLGCCRWSCFVLLTSTCWLSKIALLLATWTTLCTLAGCTALDPRGSSLTDHAEAARQINGPGQFRDEGLAAEKRRKRTGILTKMFPGMQQRKDVEKARAEYTAGETLFNQATALQGEERRDAFRAAAEKFKAAAKNWPDSSFQQDALMMKGESFFFAEDYYKSEQAYAELTKNYPRHPYVDRVDARRFEIADYWLKHDAVEHKPFVVVNLSDNKLPLNDTRGHGKRVLEKIRLDNPIGKASDDATMRLAVAAFEREDYETAADTFADLRITYPDSEHQFDAQFLELQSLLLSYRGPKYASVPLTEAEKRVKQILRQFPKESQEQSEELNLAYSKIRYLLAERHWEQADFREKRQEWGSARYYLKILVDDFSDTDFAEPAKEKLASIAENPDDPPQYLAPLAKLFPERGAERPWLQNTGQTR